MKRKTNNNAKLATREKDKFETIYILEQHELPAQRLKLTSEKTVANGEFRKKFGQLLYLENLRKSNFTKDGDGLNPEPCPICRQSLGRQWSVLQVNPKSPTVNKLIQRTREVSSMIHSAIPIVPLTGITIFT